MPAGFKVLAALAIAAALTASAGCALTGGAGRDGDSAGDDRAVRIGEVVYRHEDLDRFFRMRLLDFRDGREPDTVKSALLEAFIEEKLLLHRADSLGIAPDESRLQSMLESTATERQSEAEDPAAEESLSRNLAESLKIQQYLHDKLLRNLEVSEEECLEYYNGNLSDFVRNDMVHIREILVDDPEQAEKIQASLKANRNQNFAELARTHSKTPSAPEGGDLGRFQRGELPDKFEKIIFRMSPGTVSKTISTEYGYHIFLLEEKVLAHQQKFFEVKDRIRDRLLLERERAQIERDIAALTKEIPVEIYADGLTFRYVGTRFSTK